MENVPSSTMETSEATSVSAEAAEPTLAAIPELPASLRSQIELERRRHGRVQSAALAVLATGAVLTLMYFARPVLIVVACAMLLAFMLAPIVSLLERIRIPKPVGALFAVLLMLAALYGVFAVSYNQASDFVDQLPRYSGEIRHTLMNFQKRAEKIQKTTEGVLPPPVDDKNTVHVRQSDSWGDALTRGAASLTQVLAMASFVPFLVYFMLSWQDHVRTATVMIFKIEHRNTAYVTIGLIASMMRSFIVGNLVVGVFLSLISMVIFGIIGIPYFYFIAVISGFISLVPYLGVVLAVVPPIVAGLGHIQSEQYAIVVAGVLATHLFALNVLYPKLIGRRMQLNPLAVSLSLLFWGWLWGAMGLVLAVPITASVKVILDHVEPLQPYGAWLGENVND